MSVWITVATLFSVRVVKLPVAGVVAPTVPLILIEAVPVKLVTVPLEGVPRTPPLITGAPAVPTLTAKAVAMLVPKPDTPVLIGKPVALVNVPLVGVPRIGVTKVGLVDNTLSPEPVEVVTPVPPFRTGSVPVTPVVKGSPVALVSVTDVGVPRTGVTNVGEVANTFAPLPVSSVKAAAKFALLGVARKVATPVPKPDTPVEIGRPVAFVKVAAEGVPKSGVTKAGDVANTADPVPVSSVKAERRLALEGVAKKVATPVPKPLTPVLIGKPVALVKVPLEGVPRAGVTKVGLLANTKAPEPVSSVMAEASGAIPECGSQFLQG